MSPSSAVTTICLRRLRNRFRKSFVPSGPLLLNPSSRRWPCRSRTRRSWAWARPSTEAPPKNSSKRIGAEKHLLGRFNLLPRASAAVLLLGPPGGAHDHAKWITRLIWLGCGHCCGALGCRHPGSQQFYRKLVCANAGRDGNDPLAHAAPPPSAG